MLSLLPRPRATPIGIDIGTRAIKMVQFSADRSRLIDSVRQDLGTEASPPPALADDPDSFVEALQRARCGREFRGKEAVLCLNDRHMFLQNVRIPKGEQAAMDRVVQQEAAGRVPFPVAEAEIRYLEAADIRQGDQVLREVILMACHRPVLDRLLSVVERAGLSPVAVDVEPAAVARSLAAQYRREEDQRVRSLFVHVGHVATLVLIAQGPELLFVKYLDLGGRQFDEAVARSLKMDLAGASALRRHSGDRRSDRQDPEVARTVADSIRPIVDRLANELALCVRYHSVTFRGQPLERLVVGGGEATPALMETLNHRLSLKCELSDSLRSFVTAGPRGRSGQWDVAAGLALRDVRSPGR
ncbi:MAG: pilus assembly protein PilM [Pirellulaceae bacterium]